MYWFLRLFLALECVPARKWDHISLGTQVGDVKKVMASNLCIGICNKREGVVTYTWYPKKSPVKWHQKNVLGRKAHKVISDPRALMVDQSDANEVNALHSTQS